MCNVSRASRRLFLSMLAPSLLFLAGCPKACIRPPLTPEPFPILRQVDLYPPRSPLAEYCLTDRGRRDTLTNLELYRAALESSRKTISIYNETVKKEVPDHVGKTVSDIR